MNGVNLNAYFGSSSKGRHVFCIKEPVCKVIAWSLTVLSFFIDVVTWELARPNLKYNKCTFLCVLRVYSVYTTIQMFGVSLIVFTFFSKDAISLPNVTVNTFTLLQKKSILLYIHLNYSSNILNFQLLEWFLTLKTGEMAAGNFALPSQI